VTIQVKKGKDGQIHIMDHRGVIVATLTKEQARTLADVLVAADQMSDVSLIRIAGWGTVTVTQIRAALTALPKLRKRNRELRRRVRNLELLVSTEESDANDLAHAPASRSKNGKGSDKSPDDRKSSVRKRNHHRTD